MFDAPAGAQMSFFPSEAEQIQSIAEAESVTPSAFSMFISQDDIDHILRAGGNADAARMKIAAEFSKQKPLEDRAAFLKALYYGGNGLITDNGRLSAWYGDDGIHIATGDTSRYLRSAQVIGWADAAERIEELLDGGAFATNLEVTEAPRYERLGIAVDVWNLYHDFSDEAKSLGYLSCLGNIHSTSFPEETERLTDDLLNPAFRDRLLSEYKVFMDAYRENRALLRFHYHKSQALLTRLEDLSLPRKEFRSDMEAIPETGRFITEDEIAASLANGSGFEGGKTRIYAFFQTSHTPKENADFLKKEYGIGGHTHAVSRESGSYEDHGSKGIVLKKNGCADIQMNWNKVASRISELVRLNRYLTPDEQAAYDKEMAQDAMRNAVYNDYNDVKAAHPDEIVLYQVGDFFELYGEDARAVADDLSLELTRRNLEGVGRVTMCGFPAKDLEKYVEKLREKHDFPVIMLSAKSEEVDKVMGLNIGADDYVTKPFTPMELMARVNSQLRRYRRFMEKLEPKENVHIIGGLEINEDTVQVTMDGSPVKLTPIEYKILLLLAKNPGHVFSAEEIYERVWQERAINTDTIMVHVRNIREKIEIDPKNPKYLKVVWGVGYKIEKQS